MSQRPNAHRSILVHGWTLDDAAKDAKRVSLIAPLALCSPVWGVINSAEYSDAMEILNNNEDLIITSATQQLETLTSTRLEAEAIFATLASLFPSQRISQRNADLLAERMCLASSYSRGELSKAEYQSSKNILLEQENLIAKKQVLKASATQPSQGRELLAESQQPKCCPVLKAAVASNDIWRLKHSNPSWI